MYIQTNRKKGKNGKVYESHLLCRKYRDSGKVKTEVVLNLSSLPAESIYAIKTSLKNDGEQMIAIKDINIADSSDFGYAYAIIELMKKLRISETIEKTYKDNPNLIKLLILGKVITRGSKLGIYNWIRRNESIAKLLNIDISVLKLDDLYSALKDIGNIQSKVEQKWNIYNKTKHNEIFLYDITSSYFEGTQNELSAFGYNRDKKKGKMQITIGLITDNEGFPLKIEVFAGNTTDCVTVKDQLKALKDKFEAKKIIMVGDRGMKIKLNLSELSKEEQHGIDYITGLSTTEVRDLLGRDIIQLELFSEELYEVEENGIRYVLSNNPLLKHQKSRTRDQLRGKFELNIYSIKQVFDKRKNQNEINKTRKNDGHKGKLVTSFSTEQIDRYKLRASKLLSKYNMTKFYSIDISEESFILNFNLEEYQKAMALDGKYILTTSVSKDRLDTTEIRNEYKNLQKVEHAFRDMKTDKIEIRPIYHRKKEQTRGHVLLTMFSYAILWSMEQKIHPWLKTNNSLKNENLSFADITDELNGIKLNKICIGNEITQYKCTEQNNTQREILSILDIKLPKSF
ncbi:MAG: IS1634 family transposase [Colwellia sp.]|nr:IS1634 family transposase [Colwellia sp.]